MDPFESIFLDHDGGIKPKTFVYTDVIDDGSAVVDMTWSSYKINNELQSVRQSQVATTNIGVAGQILAMNARSNPVWMDPDEFAHFITNAEIDAIFADPSQEFPGLSIIDGNGIVHAISILNSSIGDKVDKVQGKGLSDNNFTDTQKQTIDKIISGGDITVSSGTLFINRTVEGSGT